MNKQEQIGKYEYLNHSCFRMVDTSEVLKDLRQLDEPQKVVVPQFVAEWYEEHKNNIDFEIWHYLHTFSSQKEDEFKKWMNKVGLKQIQTLVNMHQFGYEVEKEPKYIVKMKATKQPLFYNNMYEKIFFSMGDLATRFTRKQLEEVGLGWVFDCEGIEIEEVTE